ncbi:hypothetical protein [Mesobacterium pallidum]|uniref:hypothetical protein n=1 Tax=Mesobacterium pallidum TaxID=2872037 RepID=UPI001EE35B61|nr:hypothetical protein [Mesobacterium pallidum]
MDYPYDLGPYRRPVTTQVPAAQTWWDRGLMWCYGFNHEEAIACFREALAADPSLAMAHWGIAWATGPNYNMPWAIYDEAGRAAALAAAHTATEAALAGADAAAPVEQALIAALPRRYPQATPAEEETMRGWDADFAAAMRDVHALFPEDLDTATIFADALMNLTPWQMWTLDGAPGPVTAETRAVLETALARPGGMAHPGLLHLYVHLMEMSPWPELALPQADVLRTLAPGAGHLVHMPSHIDIQVGDYAAALRANEAASRANMVYYDRMGAMNLYTGYRIHDEHFAIYAALFLGAEAPAHAALARMQATVPEEMLRIESPPMADYFEAYLSMAPHILVRFGKWDQIVAMGYPEERALYCTLTAMIDYAKTVALSALGRVAEAETQMSRFEASKAAVPETRLLHNCRVVDLLDIATEMARGELAYRKGSYDVAFAHLRRAVALDDALPYDEPWGWMQPTRHALGALLLEQGRMEEAEKVYREDLGLAGALPRACQHPDNVWSLYGLMTCLDARAAPEAERRLIAGKLAIAQARSDGIAASCGCAQAAMARSNSGCCAG